MMGDQIEQLLWRGLMVSALRASGRPVYAINPMAVARYRERHSMARRVRRIVRHQPRQPEARAVLAIAPTPAHITKLTETRIAAALRRAGRQRGIDTLATEILEGLRQPQLRQPELLEQAFGRQALPLLAALDTACTGADDLEQAAAGDIRKQPDYAIIASFPGLADLTGARVLAEIGDDKTKFASNRALKAYAGSVPVTHASRKSIPITYRRIKNDRLAAAGWIWAFAAASHCDPARGHYQHRRAHGDRHAAALRHLFNKMLGQLHHRPHHPKEQPLDFLKTIGVLPNLNCSVRRAETGSAEAPTLPVVFV